MRNPPNHGMLEWLDRGGEQYGRLPAAAAGAAALTKVLLVDGQQLRLLGLREQLASTSLEVVGQSNFGPMAVRRARETTPDLILVAADEQASSAVATIQSLAYPGAAWTVVGIAEQHEPELLRKLMLAGARDVVLRTWQRTQLQQALCSARAADLRAVDAAGEAAPMGVVVSVFGVKGGIGKTTVSTNLAVALARETGRRVVIVDLDVPFGDVAVLLDLHPEQDILDAIDPVVMDDLERLQSMLVRAPQGIHVLPAPLAPDDAGALDAARVGQLLLRLASLYQFVIVDTPVGLTEITAAALDVAELGVLVTTPELTALRRTHACLRMLQGLEFPTGKVQIALNRVASKTRLSEAEAAEAVGYPIAWRLANDYAAMQSAALGQPVVLAQPKTRLARDIQVLARALAGGPTEVREGWLPWRRRRREIALA
jgi:pilus assembly protein CpaE